MSASTINDGREPPGAHSARLPVASPLDPPLVNQAMQPARAVSPEAAAMLPPVGLLSQSRTPPPMADRIGRAGPSAAPPVARSLPSPAATTSAAPLRVERVPITAGGAEVQRRWAESGGSSALLTVTMIVTAMGVGAMAIIPMLGGGGEPAAVEAQLPPRTGSAGGNHAARPGAMEPSQRAEPSVRPAQSSGSGPLDPDSEAKRSAALTDILRLLRERDVTAASERMQRLTSQGSSGAHHARIEQYAALVDAIGVFLANLQSAIDQAGAGHAIQWRGRPTPVVGVTDTTVTILVDRRQVRLQRRALSDEAVRALAEGLLDMTDPRNQAQLGAFLFVAEQGDRAEARRLWFQAAAAGEDVAQLLLLLPQPE